MMVWGQFVECFLTETWNDFSAIRRTAISHRDVIPLQTSIRDVIRGFSLEGHTHYFLTHQGRVCGLITIANVNSRPVRTYLFGLLNELETLIGYCVRDCVPEDQILGAKLADIGNAVKRYKADKGKGLEVALAQYLYIGQLLQLFLGFDLAGPLLGAETANRLHEFEKRIKDLRNRVDHPVKSLLHSREDLRGLWDEIDLIEEIIFKLRPVSHAEFVPPVAKSSLA
jgi:hypothetical protein